MSGYTVITRSDELYHYGVLGMKWGVRNYQNKDGSLTEKGKKHYGVLKEKVKRGSQYSREQNSIKTKRAEKLRDESDEYRRLTDEQKWIQFKYDLDENGKGGNTYWNTEERLASARQSWRSLQDSKDYLDSKFSKEAYDYANKVITKKYGPTALSDITTYEATAAAAIVGTLLAAALGSVALSSLLDKLG